MNIDIYDTYVRTAEGYLLHFDILLPNGEGSKATQYANEWLNSIGKTVEEISLENCRYCHTEIATPEIQQQIRERRYFIILDSAVEHRFSAVPQATWQDATYS